MAKSQYSFFSVSQIKSLLASHQLDVLLGIADQLEIKVVDEELERSGADKGRGTRSDADTLEVEVEQSEQDGNGFLLEPRDDEVEGEVVDWERGGKVNFDQQKCFGKEIEQELEQRTTTLEVLGESNGNLDGRVGVVALTQVEKTRD